MGIWDTIMTESDLKFEMRFEKETIPKRSEGLKLGMLGDKSSRKEGKGIAHIYISHSRETLGWV